VANAEPVKLFHFLLVPFLCSGLIFQGCQSVPSGLSATSVGAYAQAAATTATPFLSTAEKAELTALTSVLTQAGSGVLTPQALLQVIATFKPTTQQGIWLSLALLGAAAGYTAIYQANSTNPNVVAVTAYVVSVGQGLTNAGYCLSKTEFASYELKKLRK
jgi:hypothetical protein